MSQHQDLIKRDLTVRSVAVLLAAVATLSCLASPVARAFEAPDAAVVARAALVVAVASRVKRTSINHGRLCSWHETSSKASQDSAPFGKSGFCHWTDDARIGASCSCERTVEHAHEEHWGLVIEAPRSSSPSPVN
jgi:hypothetical protein